ncbi:ABC transporter ATP-binding protein [Nocardioides sp. R-C-SC26]|uniref:ABC transporter ATP-binding protein n=1 Tax=Nocardioides sp. R-C-SC26 TaxID=2870414 RepID=UPI001E31AACC|nr:ABC transporter ATP-binding protein [Nocardioides sp. R-C-SC26]
MTETTPVPPVEGPVEHSAHDDASTAADDVGRAASATEVAVPAAAPFGPPPPAVLVTGLTKRFGTRKGAVHALQDVELRVEPGEFVSLIGPSGCGKSTLMRLIADLEKPTSGSIEVFGKTVKQARADQDYGIAFQQAGLLPWRTVAANIALPLELHGVSRKERRERVSELAEMVGLTDFVKHHPDQLSGGMQQRVAIARSLAEQPRLLLMDEPFGALDEMTRERMQGELSRIARETGAAVVFVTHSIPEAVFLSDRVVVMSPRPGRITGIVETGIGADAARDEALRENPAFFAKVTEVREALHGVPVAEGGREAR